MTSILFYSLASVVLYSCVAGGVYMLCEKIWKIDGATHPGPMIGGAFWPLMIFVFPAAFVVRLPRWIRRWSLRQAERRAAKLTKDLPKATLVKQPKH